MALQGTGDQPAGTILKFHDCPACKETIFAAEGATFTPFAVMFTWQCDLCGHRFETVEPLEQAA